MTLWHPRLSGQPLGQGFALDELHHKKVMPRILADEIEAHDVGVVQRFQNFDFVFEFVSEFFAGTAIENDGFESVIRNLFGSVRDE